MTISCGLRSQSISGLLTKALRAVAMLAGLALVPHIAARDAKTNFVICIADDISFNDFGCYGNKAARTPRIDALAARGMRFDEAYLTASSCSPSRSSIIAGRYPHNLGPAAELHEPIAAHLPWLPTVLRQAGYHTGLVGKNHMTVTAPEGGSAPAAEAWDVLDPGVSPDNHGGEARWVETIQKRPNDKPFFFWFASMDAHRGWDADRDWDETLYGPKHRPQDMTVPPFLVDDEPTRADLASYHNEITRFDHFVGRVVDALSSEGVIENTVILVIADNGRPFPRAKTRLHDSGMKTPFIAHWPAGMKKAGTTCASLVSVIDIAPTFLELAGLPPVETFQGVSIAPLFADPAAVTRNHAFSEHNWHDYEAHGRAVRSGGYLYIRNSRPALAWQGPADSVRSPSHKALRAARDEKKLTPAQADVFLAPRPPEELYLTADDPNQLRNLVKVPSHAAAKQTLSELLDTWSKETGDAAPENLSADAFDRETGEAIGKRKTRVRGKFPGAPHRADRINSPGPR